MIPRQSIVGAVVFVTAMLIVDGEALRCFTCINAKSNQECNEKGEMVECQVNARACENELRLSSNGFGYSLTKRCKQPRACTNSQNQNFQPAWNTTQCNPRFPQNSVCRCCCEGDLCNGQALPCNDIIRCPSRGQVNHGNVVCTNNNFLNSTCKYSCTDGYKILGESSVKCVEDGYDYVWSAAEPTCRATLCSGVMNSPRDGSMECTDGKNVQSRCTFSCKIGYKLVGPKITSCLENTRWNGQAPKCERIICQGKHFNPVNGVARCSDGNNYDSVCQFSCDDGYYLVGFGSSTCQKSGKWSFKAPICKIITCEDNISSPKNGGVICSNDNIYQSECEYFCDEGYFLDGQKMTLCQKDFQWSEKAPTCRQIRCEPTLPSPVNGAIDCSDSNLYASVCVFACGKGFELIGSETSFCQENFEWSDEPAACQQITCNALEVNSLANGQAVCSDSNVVDSTCTFVCDDGYFISGEQSTTCTEEGWTGVAPVCERHTCAEPEPPINGIMECSEDNLSFSNCTYTCGDGDVNKWEAMGDDITTCTRDLISNVFMWNNDPPCCARKCPPYAQIDLFIVLDSSSSVGKANWKKTISFVSDVISSYVVSQNDMLIAAVRYNKFVDSESEVKLGAFKDTESTVNAIKNIPYDGSGTKTGQALKYVVEEMLTHPGNRPTVQDMVLILTDGISQDDVKEPGMLLRSTGANVVAVGIVNERGGLKEEDLLDITSDPSKTIMLPDGFDGLTPEAVERITKQICQSPCERVNMYNGYFQLSKK